MKILFCNYEYPPLGGGGGVINAHIAEELAKKNEVTVLTSKGLGLLGEENINGVHVVRVPILFRKMNSVASFLSMLSFLISGYFIGFKLVTQNKYDVLNTHFVLPTGPLGHILSRAGKIPNVLSLHGGDLYDPSKKLSPHGYYILRVVIRYLLRQADAIVGQSNNTLNNIKRFYGSDVSGVLIPLAIKDHTIEIEDKKKYALKDDDIVLVTVGRLIKRKAIEQLIKIINELDNKKNHLFVIGSGPEEYFLRAEVKRLALETQIHFLGFIAEEEKYRILNMSDIYVSTAQHEGFGIVFLEAMSAGLPVVCYDYGGQTDFLQSDVTGFVVPLNNLNAFKGKIHFLISAAAEREKISKNNKEKATEYCMERCAGRYLSVFNDVIEKRHKDDKCKEKEKSNFL